MKLSPLQMLGLTVGAIVAWSLCKAARQQSARGDDWPVTLGEAIPPAGSSAGTPVYEDADADPPRNRMPSVGDLPP